MTSFKLLIIPILTLLISCNDAENKKLIEGKWTCVDWTVKGQSKLDENVSVEFTFQADGKYEYRNASLYEKGSYKVRGGKLYTTPENELEIAVVIEKINADTLVFNMSRGGTPESMFLVKTKL